MKFGSVCSGIEAASVAWHPLGWRAQWFAEIEKFPSAVLAHHYPHVPNYGDFTKITPRTAAPIDLLVGGTPCQAFSVAGKRKGLEDSRGNLTLEFLKLAGRLQPRWIVWENVPGVLSIDEGRTFGTFLRQMAKLGYGFAYRILDAQYTGVPQRRRRVFVVGCFGDWRSAASVLFESESLLGYPAPGKKPGQRVAGCLTVGANQLTGRPGDITEVVSFEERYYTRGQSGKPSLLSPTLTVGNGHGDGKPLIAFTSGHDGSDCGENLAPTLRMSGEPAIASRNLRVRRLTTRECGRLQGFPDDYTLIKSASDGSRYRAYGNSMAVPVMRWIGERIQLVENTNVSINQNTSIPLRRAA